MFTARFTRAGGGRRYFSCVSLHIHTSNTDACEVSLYHADGTSSRHDVSLNEPPNENWPERYAKFELLNASGALLETMDAPPSNSVATLHTEFPRAA